MRFLFIVLLAFTLNSCGNLMSASLIESFLTPTSLMMTVADYGLEKETGKKTIVADIVLLEKINVKN